MTFSRLLMTCVLVLAGVFRGESALACSCLYRGDFDVFAREEPVVVRAVVISHGPQLSTNNPNLRDMVVKVTEVVKGDVEGAELTLYGDTGMSCLHYINREYFPLASEHYFALRGGSGREPLPGCGESYVHIDGEPPEGETMSPLRERYMQDVERVLDELRD